MVSWYLCLTIEICLDLTTYIFYSKIINKDENVLTDVHAIEGAYNMYIFIKHFSAIHDNSNRVWCANYLYKTRKRTLINNISFLPSSMPQCSAILNFSLLSKFWPTFEGAFTHNKKYLQVKWCALAQ